MNKWWWFGGGIALILIVVAGIYFFSQPKVLNEWSTDEKAVVLSNKAWKVVFSDKIDPDSVTSNEVYVTDADGTRQSVTFSLSSDLKTLTIQPPENGYGMDSEYYTLHVSDGIVSTDGRHIKASRSMSFIVKETLPTIDSKKELHAYFATILKEEKKRMKTSLGREGGAESGRADLASADSAKSSGEAIQDFSKTNNQVQGVDEADIVKTDGTYLYEVMDGKVIISKLVPADEMEVLTTISYKQPEFSPMELFLYKDRLVVIGHSFDDTREKDSTSITDSLFPPAYQSMKAIVYDVSDRSEPNVLREVEMEGSYVSSRRVDGIVYLVAQHYPNYWRVAEQEKTDLRPRVLDTAVSGKKHPVKYDDIRYFPQSKETNFTMIGSFNLDKPEEEANFTTYLGGGRNLYMSQDHLYLAVTSYPKIALDTRQEWSPDSTIYKFSVDDETVTFDGSAEVPGRILNQFSMDEHDGDFRVVTTKGSTWNEDQPSSNNLYIYDENLKQIGKLEDLARGERIYSARFMQDRVYMVTFKQVDPLFVIDASNPRKPKVLGELKIPGFSNYLHPYDETHLIGFGYETKTVSSPDVKRPPRILTQGVKVSLFDVSDVNHPVEMDSEVIGGRGTHSQLNNDHKALFVHNKRGLYGFPITVYEEVEGSEYEQKFIFQGAMLYQIDLEKGIQLKEKITHMKGNQPYEEWENTIRRMVYIGDHLYAVSPKTITSYNLDTLKQVGGVRVD